MNVIEFFCCSGGMAEGLRRAGLHVTQAFDFDPDACESYERNLGHKPFRMDVRDLLRMVRMGWRPTPVKPDLLVADPPCTPWSRAGKRKGTTDPNDMLKETVALIAELRPVHWLIANVPGLDDGPNWPVVQELIGGLSRFGYCIDFARLDACDYGVPQHRVRPFWYGHPIGRPHVRWPERTHENPKVLALALPVPGVPALAPWVTCRQALGHLADKDRGHPIRLRWRGCNGKQVASVPDEPARVVGTSNLSDGNVLAHPDVAMRKSHKPSKKPRASHADSPAGTVTTTNNGNGGMLYDGPELVGREREDGTVRENFEDAPAHTIRGGRSSGERMIFEPGTIDEPSKTVRAACRGTQSVLVEHRMDGYESREDSPARSIRASRTSNARMLIETPRHPPSNLDEPSRTIVAGDGGVASRILKTNGKHPPSDIDRPALTIPSSQPGNGGVILNGNTKHPPADPDEPAPTLGAKDRGPQSAQAMAWPWDRPSTTVTADDQGRLAPPCHHGKSFLSDNRGHGPNAIKLSELACKILQGFPEDWHFAGKTKRARWAQLGMAMPPALAAAVGRSIRIAMGG